MGSIWTARTRLLLLVAGLLLVLKLGREVYRWAVFGEERDDLRRLGIALDGTALSVMRTQIVADSLRRAIHQLDADLAAERTELSDFEKRADGNGLPPALFDEYREQLEQYNRKVAARNRGYERWKGVVQRNHRAVHGYNSLADSIRGIGAKIGEPYITIPSPAEVAVRHGLDTTSAFVSSQAKAED